MSVCVIMRSCFIILKNHVIFIIIQLKQSLSECQSFICAADYLNN